MSHRIPLKLFKLLKTTVLSSISCIGRCRGRPPGYRQWKLRYSFGIPSEEREKYNNRNNLKSTTIARETTYLALRNIIQQVGHGTNKKVILLVPLHSLTKLVGALMATFAQAMHARKPTSKVRSLNAAYIQENFVRK